MNGEREKKGEEERNKRNKGMEINGGKEVKWERVKGDGGNENNKGLCGKGE